MGLRVLLFSVTDFRLMDWLHFVNRMNAKREVSLVHSHTNEFGYVGKTKTFVLQMSNTQKKVFFFPKNWTTIVQSLLKYSHKS